MASTEESPGSTSGRKPPRKTRGTVVIMPNRCKGCGFCVAFCPTEALGMGEEMNAKGYYYPELRYPDRCNGCDLCGMLCPDFALYGYFERKKKRSRK